jgi:hypothetical protein
VALHLPPFMALMLVNQQLPARQPQHRSGHWQNLPLVLIRLVLAFCSFGYRCHHRPAYHNSTITCHACTPVGGKLRRLLRHSMTENPDTLRTRRPTLVRTQCGKSSDCAGKAAQRTGRSLALQPRSVAAAWNSWRLCCCCCCHRPT